MRSDQERGGLSVSATGERSIAHPPLSSSERLVPAKITVGQNHCAAAEHRPPSSKEQAAKPGADCGCRVAKPRRHLQVAASPSSKTTTPPVLHTRQSPWIPPRTCASRTWVSTAGDRLRPRCATPSPTTTTEPPANPDSNLKSSPSRSRPRKATPSSSSPPSPRPCPWPPYLCATSTLGGKLAPTRSPPGRAALTTRARAASPVRALISPCAHAPHAPPLLSTISPRQTNEPTPITGPPSSSACRAGSARARTPRRATTRPATLPSACRVRATPPLPLNPRKQHSLYSVVYQLTDTASAYHTSHVPARHIPPAVPPAARRTTRHRDGCACAAARMIWSTMRRVRQARREGMGGEGGEKRGEEHISSGWACGLIWRIVLGGSGVIIWHRRAVRVGTGENA